MTTTQSAETVRLTDGSDVEVASRRRVMGFRSQDMRRRGVPATYSLYRLIAAHPGGPAKMITGEVASMPASGLWEHVRGARQHATLSDALIAWPDAENGETRK